MSCTVVLVLQFKSPTHVPRRRMQHRGLPCVGNWRLSTVAVARARCPMRTKLASSLPVNLNPVTCWPSGISPGTKCPAWKNTVQVFPPAAGIFFFFYFESFPSFFKSYSFPIALSSCFPPRISVARSQIPLPQRQPPQLGRRHYSIPYFYRRPPTPRPRTRSVDAPVLNHSHASPQTHQTQLQHSQIVGFFLLLACGLLETPIPLLPTGPPSPPALAATHASYNMQAAWA